MITLGKTKTMIIEINTDNNIDGNDRLKSYITEQLEGGLFRFEEKITRIEVHIGDENSDKFGLNDKRCMIEARLEKIPPVAVTGNGDTLEKAFSNALDKIKKVLGTTFDKMRSH